VDIACNGLPAGYAPKPLAEKGPCHDGGCSAEYPCLSTVACTTYADCGALGSACDPCMHFCACSAEQCCPTNWLLYSCAYPDGGTGLACHNPAMGCASSTACGEGCDMIVFGRCGV
jgi:hypothetical protein